jgi:hypothetical protein
LTEMSQTSKTETDEQPKDTKTSTQDKLFGVAYLMC